MKRAHRVVVVSKKSTYEMTVREGRSARVRRLLREGDPSVARLREAHEDHRGTVAATRRLLADLGVEVEELVRGEPGRLPRADLVVTLGGDGTLLWTSHLVDADTPLFAINSAPRDSVGYFCGGTKDDLEETLTAAVRGRLPATRLARMRVDMDEKTLSRRVLNDVLFCHECPAVTSRYLIRRGEVEEEQKSSGLWVGPAAGSTAAQRSAGGRALPIGSKKIQYVVREPYHPRAGHYRLTCGLLSPGQTLELRCKMRAGRLFIDGAHRMHTVDIGSRVVMQSSDETLTLLGLRPDGRR